MSEKEQKITTFNLTIVIVLCLASLSYGYSFSIVSTTLGQPSWFVYFDLTQDTTDARYAFTNSIIGTMNGLFSVGGVLGAIFVAWSCDALGRKKTLLIASPMAVLGGAFQGGAVHIGMFLVGRLLSGFAVGILVVMAPVFQSEIAPPAVRGFLVSQHGVVLVLGYSLAAWVGVACYFSKNTAFQWRFPLALQCLWPIGMFVLTPILPESPRWLLMKGRTEEARQVVLRLHAGHTDPDSVAAHFAKREYFQMKSQVEVDMHTAASETVWTLFTRPSYRKRMICAAIVMFGAESTGILVVYNYSVLLYQGLGFTGSIPLILAAAYVTVACIGNYINSLLIDRVGRVLLLVIGWTGCLVSLIFEAALSARYIGQETPNEAGLSAGVFFLFLYIAFYGCCVDANTFVYCAEIFPTHLRSRGMGFALGVLFTATIAYLIPAPTAFADVGWKFYLLFILLTAIMAPVGYWYLPETMGLSLEEINEKFGDEVTVHLTHITEAEGQAMEQKLEAEMGTVEHKEATV